MPPVDDRHANPVVDEREHFGLPVDGDHFDDDDDDVMLLFEKTSLTTTTI